MATSPLALYGRTLPTLGVQLYTVRSVIGDKPLETLKALEAIGFREVEATYGNLETIAPLLKQTSLKPVSLHLDTAMFTRDQAKLQPAIENAKSKGFSYVVCPYVAQQDRGGPEVMKKLADSLNKAGEIANKNGLRLCYHNHAFEFAAAGSGTLLDVLMQASDPKLVALELDVMWAQVAGVDLASFLKQYGSRTLLMHLKDVDAAEPKRFDEGIARTSFKEAGAGSVKFAELLKAATQAGVKHYFVEQDQTPGDPVASLRQSYAYLSKLNF